MIDAAIKTSPASTVGRKAVNIPIKRSIAPPIRNSANAALAAFLAFTNVGWSFVICDIDKYYHYYYFNIPLYYILIR